MATAAQSQSALSTRTQKKQVIVEVAGRGWLSPPYTPHGGP
jgi:hypothetical protein